MTRDPVRFADWDSLQGWWAERDRVLCLHDTCGDLLGVLWMSEKSMPERDDYIDERICDERPVLTWALRLYGRCRGRRLASPFALQGLRQLCGSDLPPPALWFETKAVNLAVRRFTAHLGFVEVSGEAGGTVIGMRRGGVPWKGGRRLPPDAAPLSS